MAFKKCLDEGFGGEIVFSIFFVFKSVNTFNATFFFAFINYANCSTPSPLKPETKKNTCELISSINAHTEVFHKNFTFGADLKMRAQLVAALHDFHAFIV